MEIKKTVGETKTELYSELGIMLRRLLETKSISFLEKHPIEKSSSIQRVQKSISDAVRKELIWRLAGLKLLGVSQKEIDSERYEDENSFTIEGRRVVYNGSVKKLPHR